MENTQIDAQERNENSAQANGYHSSAQSNDFLQNNPNFAPAPVYQPLATVTDVAYSVQKQPVTSPTENDLFTLRLRHQKVLFWGGAVWHEYRDIRKLRLLKPPREVFIPDPTSIVNQGVVSPQLQAALSTSTARYVR